MAVPIVPYIDYWSNLLYLDKSFTTAIHQKQDQCGYTAYLEKYLTYPPPAESFPVLPAPTRANNYTCDIFDEVYNAALLSNPCFNIYHITGSSPPLGGRHPLPTPTSHNAEPNPTLIDTCPHLWSVLGIVNPDDYDPPNNNPYFNRSDVQAAINAPPTSWYQCTPRNVFDSGVLNNRTVRDSSLGPAQNDVLAHVIDTLNNTYIGVGELDFLLPTNGTLLALQNMTWGGKQGFQKRPNDRTFFVPYHEESNGGALSAAGDVGTWGSERGLVFYSVQLGGHELPGYAPGAGYRVVEAMLGRISDIGQTGAFTTQEGGGERAGGINGTAGMDDGAGNSTTAATVRVGRERPLEQYPAGGVFRHGSSWGPGRIL